MSCVSASVVCLFLQRLVFLQVLVFVSTVSCKCFVFVSAVPCIFASVLCSFCGALFPQVFVSVSAVSCLSPACGAVWLIVRNTIIAGRCSLRCCQIVDLFMSCDV